MIQSTNVLARLLTSTLSMQVMRVRVRLGRLRTWDLMCAAANMNGSEVKGRKQVASPRDNDRDVHGLVRVSGVATLTLSSSRRVSRKES